MINLAVGLIYLYCLVIALIFGVQKSISASFYTTNQRYYFTVIMLVSSFLLMAGAGQNIWFIFGGFFLGLVGVAPNYKWKVWIAEYIHGGGVIASILCYLIGFALINIWVGLAALFLILGTLAALKKLNNKIWWIEITIIFIIYLSLKYLGL